MDKNPTSTALAMCNLFPNLIALASCCNSSLFLTVCFMYSNNVALGYYLLLPCALSTLQFLSLPLIMLLFLTWFKYFSTIHVSDFTLCTWVLGSKQRHWFIYNVIATLISCETGSISKKISLSCCITTWVQSWLQNHCLAPKYLFYL